MAALKIFTVATMVVGLISSATAMDFIIKRNSTQKLPSVYDSIDKFNISECSGIDDDLCTKYGGQRLYDKCQCICSQDKSTFGFYIDKWGCTDNSIVQQHAACGYAFERPGSKGDHSPLFTLPVLGSHGDSNYIGNIPRNKSCKVITANATFLTCDGTWGKLTESSVKRKLAFQDHQQGLVYVGPYQPSSPSDPSLDGRVIRIPIKCEGLTWNSSQCVVFKIKGQLTCTYFSGSSRDIPPITTDEPTKTLFTLFPTSTTTTDSTGNNKKSKGDDTTPAAAVIAGSVVGGIAFVILIVVIIVMIIYWKRRKNKAKKKSIRHAQDNLAYEQGPDLSMTLTRPTSIRPLPEPPSQLPYEYLDRGPSTVQYSNGGMIPGSPGQGAYDHCEGEPVYGEIDDTYSRLNHPTLQATRSRNSNFNFAAHGPTSSFSSGVPDKTSTLKSNDGSGSGICSFEEYDVVGGQIKSSIPRENTLKPGGPNSLGRDSNVAYDVPESVIKSSSAERPKSSNEDNATVSSDTMNQPLQRDTPQRDVYETVWDDDDDDLVTRIDLS